MPRYHNIDGVKVQFTAEEETARDAQETAWANGEFDREIAKVRSKRNTLISECFPFYLTANSGSPGPTLWIPPLFMGNH